MKGKPQLVASCPPHSPICTVTGSDLQPFDDGTTLQPTEPTQPGHHSLLFEIHLLLRRVKKLFGTLKINLLVFLLLKENLVAQCHCKLISIIERSSTILTFRIRKRKIHSTRISPVLFLRTSNFSGFRWLSQILETILLTIQRCLS